MRLKHESKLVLPWEEKRKRVPTPIKAVWFLLLTMAFVGIFLNQCTVPEAKAHPDVSGEREVIQLRRREIKALESIALSLKAIARSQGGR